MNRVEEFKNIVLAIAAVLASVKTALELFDRFKKNDSKND
ncbi:hypothetical protein SD77_0602 [Bacillus badius]|uniref:Uncharacterized protein n=1 Tax=Bacillus badius TaxID=1455 RepID=A0ABR5B1C9_BACBA|nr:hypothetical protein SD77_0602 [Bacillus badius]